MANRSQAGDLLGRQTKGQTRPGRLQLFNPIIDRLLEAMPSAGHPFSLVDIGIGSHPATTIEWANHLTPPLPSEVAVSRITGIERDEGYVAAANSVLHSSSPGLPTVRIVHGSFDHAAVSQAAIVRVANVLRVYSDAQRIAAESALASRLPSTAFVVEVTCTPEGHLGTALVSHAQDRSLVPLDLVFAFAPSAAETGGFAPIRFRDWLPRRYRRTCTPQSDVGKLLAEWKDCWSSVRPKLATDANSFVASSQALAQGRDDVVCHAPLGLVHWRLPQSTPG